MSDPTLLVIDFSNACFRVFHGYAKGEPLYGPNGELTTVSHGLLSMTYTLIELVGATHVAFAFDSRGKTFRSALSPDYKAGRAELPETLPAQLSQANVLVGALGHARYRSEGFEADDVMATMARHGRDYGFGHVYLATGDRDLMGAVSEHATLLWLGQGTNKLTDPERTNWYTPAKVEARYGVSPALFADRKALVGDTSDKIPGVRGIGEGAGPGLIALGGSFDGLYELLHAAEAAQARAAAAEVPDAVPADEGALEVAEAITRAATIPAGQRKKLLADEAGGRLSYALGKLRDDVPLTCAGLDVEGFSMAAGRLGYDDRPRALAALERLGLRSIARRLPAVIDASRSAA